MPRPASSTITSKVVPTEYDVQSDQVGFALRNPFTKHVLMTPAVPLTGHLVLIDDRGRRFRGRTLAAAFRRAERAQDPSDPIHHPPYPSPMEVPAS